MSKIRFKKLRLWLVYPVFIVYPFVARMTDASYYIGLSLMVLGLLIRFWASGYISKSRTLATSGPYAYTRNPLYLGNFVLGLGVSAVSNNVWLILYYALSFVILYIGTIKEEQAVLQEKFGQEYRDYIASVPMFLPTFKLYKKSAQGKFDIVQSFKNGEFIRLFGFLLLMVLIALWRSFIVKREHLNRGNMLSIFLFVVFLQLLWFNIYIRRKSEEKRRQNL
jgi:protein-S-isoprenylcysteine O-methyltransferase Ste14